MNKMTVFIGLLLVVIACKKASEILPELPELFEGFAQPANFPAPVYNITKNPISKEQFELGKKLFYDARLSRNNTISCGSCHIPAAGFTHHGHDVSHGIDDQLGIRNSMPIMNVAWNKAFFWDGGVADLDLLAIVPIENPVEMDESVPNILKKLERDEQYRSLFEKAYGTSEITSIRFLKALSSFMLMATSSNAKYDKVMRKEGAHFTQEEEKGYALFRSKCANCHPEPLFTDGTFRSNGLTPSAVNDLGRYDITLNPLEKYKFKVPSLRNLRYTAPFMHDGRFLNLEGVLNHYSNEVVDNGTLDPLLKNSNDKLGIQLTVNERALLLAFLETLNDESFIQNKLLAE